MGNNQADKACMDQLADEVTKDGYIPDIVIVSNQEAKTTIKLKRMSERLAKRLDYEGTSFQQLYEGHMSVNTKPKNIKNYVKPSETSLGILLNPRIADRVSIDYITPPGSVRDKESINKGGVYVVLRIKSESGKERRIGIIACHLDSNSQELRAKEVAKLMDEIGGEELDTVMFVGDHNERLDMEAVEEGSIHGKRCRLKGADEAGVSLEAQKALLDEFGPFSGDGVAHFTDRGFVAAKVSQFTHHEKRGVGETRIKHRRGVPDAGGLDGTILRTAKSIQDTVQAAQVIDVKDAKGQEASDHKAVLVRFEFNPEAADLDAHRAKHHREYLEEKYKLGAANDAVLSALAAADRYICHRASDAEGGRYILDGLLFDKSGLKATEAFVRWLKQHPKAEHSEVRQEALDYLFAKGESYKDCRPSKHHKHSRYAMLKSCGVLEQSVDEPKSCWSNLFQDSFMHMSSSERVAEVQGAEAQHEAARMTVPAVLAC
ncbi:nuclease [Piscirickettsia salmonis]|nr:nuclease [Piscirickettsia salmonis]QHS30653.1 nuclease [Piscirickettsia salmonis]